MQDQITRLREHPEQLRPPATIEELAELRAVLGVEQLPRAVLLLYADHGGMDPAQTHLPLRLLSPVEAADAIRNWREFGVPFEDRELGVFWSDDNGNDAGVFTVGPLRNRVFVIDHEEPSSEPRWTNAESFYDALLDARDQELLWWGEMRTDYPRRPNRQYPPDDDDLADDFFAIHECDPSSPAGRIAGFRALALSVPQVHDQRVLALLNSDDMWIQERAVNILGVWGNPDDGWGRPEVIEPLVKMARGGSHNGRLAAMAALRRIDTPEARSVRLQLRREFGPIDGHMLGSDLDDEGGGPGP